MEDIVEQYNGLHKNKGNRDVILSLNQQLMDAASFYSYQNKTSLSDIVNKALKYYIMNDRATTTYVMGDSSGNIKIGKTKDIDKRLKQFQTGNPTIKLLLEYNGDIEKDMHKKYYNFKISDDSTEWFNLPNKAMEDLVITDRFHIVDEDDWEQFLHDREKRKGA